MRLCKRVELTGADVPYGGEPLSHAIDPRVLPELRPFGERALPPE